MAKNTQPQPQPQTDENDVAPVTQPVETVTLPGKAGKPGPMAQITADKAKSLAEKAAIQTEVTQQLAEASDYWKEGKGRENEAEEIAAKCATRLYQAQVNRVMSADEVSNLLGNVFGFRPKADGSPGKTPAGPGATIRMRIVRTANAHEFATNPTSDGGSYFADLPVDAIGRDGDGREFTVSDVIQSVEDGDITVWTAYKRFEAIKAANRGDRPNAAFDAKRVTNMADALAKSIEASATALAGDADLLEAYAFLGRVIVEIDATLASRD